MIADKNNTAMFIGEFFVESINGFNGDVIALSDLPEQRSTAFVTHRKEYKIVTYDWRRDNGGRFVDVKSPQQLSIVGPHAHRSAAGQLHVDADITNFRNNNRTMTGASVTFPLRRPDLLPSQFVECHHCVFRTTGRADQIVAIDQNRFTVAPHFGFLAAELGFQIDFPLFFSFCAYAKQFSGRSHHVNSIFVDRWC